MQFPVYLRIGQISLHPHWVFETLAYFVAFRVYLWLRNRNGDVVSDENRWWVIAAMAIGAAVGSKILFWFEDPRLTAANWNNPVYLMSGKTIVGALIGGLIAVEWAKRRLGISRRTGDLLALPIIVGTAIGRIGCFLTGTEDHTAGSLTQLPWGVNFGDGPRHPTQLYEILFLILLGIFIVWLSRRPHREGDLFKCYFVSYLAFRFAVDFLKPEVRIIAGLSAIQCASLIALLYVIVDRHWESRRSIALSSRVAEGS
jgi:phosphatidylglycerol---prolipoprotein diacylglyceryl transferase